MRSPAAALRAVHPDAPAKRGEALSAPSATTQSPEAEEQCNTSRADRNTRSAKVRMRTPLFHPENGSERSGTSHPSLARGRQESALHGRSLPSRTNPKSECCFRNIQPESARTAAAHSSSPAIRQKPEPAPQSTIFLRSEHDTQAEPAAIPPPEDAQKDSPSLSREKKREHHRSRG